MDLTKIRFVAARNFHGGRVRPIRAVVLHDMEWAETAHTAEDCAQYFAGPNAPEASTHFCVDNGSIVQGVRLGDTAWAAPGLNADGIQIELAGFAAQHRSDWLDGYSRSELALAAKLVATLCVKYSIPIRRLTVAQVKDGTSRGIAGHLDVTNAFPQLGTGHTDPGPNFPWDVFLSMVQAESDALSGKTWTRRRIAAVAALVAVPVAVFIGVTQRPDTPTPKPPTPTPTPTATSKPVPSPTVRPKPRPSPSPAPRHRRRHPVPAPVFYTVRSGDSLWLIAQRYHLTVEKLLELNMTIYPGQKLRVK